MDQLNASETYSPYRMFNAARWSEFRADTPLTLSADEVERRVLATVEARLPTGAGA